jgi:hypothetical protein
VITRREAALRLDIPLEMARRNGIPGRLSVEELTDIDEHPPVWLAQSRANRTGKRPVWIQLTCTICGFTEAARPKKWWPPFIYITCADHRADELPQVAAGYTRREYDGIGSRFVGIVDVAPHAANSGPAGEPEPGGPNGSAGANGPAGASEPGGASEPAGASEPGGPAEPVESGDQANN